MESVTQASLLQLVHSDPESSRAGPTGPPPHPIRIMLSLPWRKWWMARVKPFLA